MNYPDVSSPRSSVSRITVMHDNVKEVISKITSIISSEGINIANLLDKSKGDKAYLIVDLDEKPSKKVIDAIGALDFVTRLRVL